MAHPRHTYETKPSWGLVRRATQDAWEATHRGLELVRVDLRQGSTGPWEQHLVRQEEPAAQ